MNMLLRKYQLVLFLLFAGIVNLLPAQKIEGVSMVSPRKYGKSAMLDPIAGLGANWIALTPFRFAKQGSPEIRDGGGETWWGDRLENMGKLIDWAHERNLKVLLKPHVWVSGGWAGDFSLETEVAWERWEQEYENMILGMAKIAAEHDAEMFCIGTEYKKSVLERPQFWRQLIPKVRAVFPGKLTYAANWDNFHKIPFWNQLDYIGLDAYFPLSEAKTPNLKSLRARWKAPSDAIKTVQKHWNKPILFTEYGYKSIDHTAWKQWEFENRPTDQNVNLKAQEIAYQAIFEVFWEEPWFAGGFIWKWYPDHNNPGGIKNSDYTPQNKPVLKMIREVYQR